MTAKARYALAARIAADMTRFIEATAAGAVFDPRPFRVAIPCED